MDGWMEKGGRDKNCLPTCNIETYTGGTYGGVTPITFSDCFRGSSTALNLAYLPLAGLYLTDLCFLFDVPNREHQVESTLNMIAYCQNSTYGEREGGGKMTERGEGRE